jgi:Uma2 family endonuclease
VARVQTKISPPRYRIPDICVTIGKPGGNIITEPPFLCIEINSPDDSVSELRAKIEEYLDMGVQYVWVVDPVLLTGEIYTRDRIARARDGVFLAGDIEVDIRQA